MYLKTNNLLQGLAIVAMGLAMTASAQTPAPAPAPAPAATPAPAPADAPAAAPAAPVWSVGTIDFSGFVDGYFTYNFNTPDNQDGNATLSNGLGGGNQLYNFNGNSQSFSLSAAKVTINHDPDPVGAHVDLIFGETNKYLHPTNDTNFVEQAFLSFKPAKAKGFEMDFGQFVTSAGAEVIEAKDNWNYSRSLLFSYAIPYYHLGVRTSFPVTKTWTAGVQVVNGWNNAFGPKDGVTAVLTSALVKPKYTWNLNYLAGPGGPAQTKGFDHLVDTTFLTTLPGKINYSVNFDYQVYIPPTGGNASVYGVAAMIRDQFSAKSAFSGRYEYLNDPEGFSTGAHQDLNEITATYEYKWIEGLLSRVEYRLDHSSVNFFTKNSQLATISPTGYASGGTQAQSTLTVAFIAFFGPKR